MYKLHVSANSGHHQVYYRFKRKSHIWVGVLIKRSLVSMASKRRKARVWMMCLRQLYCPHTALARFRNIGYLWA